MFLEEKKSWKHEKRWKEKCKFLFYFSSPSPATILHKQQRNNNNKNMFWLEDLHDIHQKNTMDI